MCSFPDEFTCKSATCVDIFKRCDNKKDCDDGSDEEDCKRLQVPATYDKSLPPTLEDEEAKPNDILTQVRVVNIDFINTVDMVVGLTVELAMKWKDYMINYVNVKDSKEDRVAYKIIPNDEKDQVWIPLSELVHDNAIIGQTKTLNFYELGVEVTGDAEPMDPGNAREELIYSGKDNNLLVKQGMKLEFRCEFFLLYFPFDETTCDFLHSIRTIGNQSIMMRSENNSVIYEGPSILNEFQIIKFWSKTSHQTLCT